MIVRIEHHDYGKARVRLLKVRRRGAVHDIREITLRIMAEGDFEAAYTEGDNRNVLPTDTIKNTVYALAHSQPVDRIESFGAALAQHFLDSHGPIRRVTVDLVEHDWARISVAGREGRLPHPHAFYRSGGETWTARVTADRGAQRVESGIAGLRILKSAGSGFEGFPRDRFTTLEETRDRVFATEVNATWTWARPPSDYAASNFAARDAMLQVFANEYSPSVQHTIHAMGRAVLERSPEIERIHISLPNLHCVPVNLAPFGLENPNEIFVPTDEPHGLIEATIGRA